MLGSHEPPAICLQSQRSVLRPLCPLHNVDVQLASSLFWMCFDGTPGLAPLVRWELRLGEEGALGSCRGLCALCPCSCHVVAKLGAFQPLNRSREL